MTRLKGWLERFPAVLGFFLVAVIVAGVVLVQVLASNPSPSLIPTPTLPPSPGPTATAEPIRVYVSGAVHAPDVYVLDADSIVKDVVLAAGGATEEADLNAVNMAQPLADGMHVHIPRLGEQATPIQLPASRRGSLLVNINTADALELESLPGIGPALAQRVVEYRSTHGPFPQIEAITDVPGIGPATFEGMRDLITVD